MLKSIKHTNNEINNDKGRMEEFPSVCKEKKTVLYITRRENILRCSSKKYHLEFTLIIPIAGVLI